MNRQLSEGLRSKFSWSFLNSDKLEGEDSPSGIGEIPSSPMSRTWFHWSEFPFLDNIIGVSKFFAFFSRSIENRNCDKSTDFIAFGFWQFTKIFVLMFTQLEEIEFLPCSETVLYWGEATCIGNSSDFIEVFFCFFSRDLFRLTRLILPFLSFGLQSLFFWSFLSYFFKWERVNDFFRLSEYGDRRARIGPMKDWSDLMWSFKVITELSKLLEMKLERLSSWLLSSLWFSDNSFLGQRIYKIRGLGSKWNSAYIVYLNRVCLATVTGGRFTDNEKLSDSEVKLRLVNWGSSLNNSYCTGWYCSIRLFSWLTDSFPKLFSFELISPVWISVFFFKKFNWGCIIVFFPPSSTK